MTERSREEILAILKAAGDRWVSGADLAERLGVSRTAIWKQMEALRIAGYSLEALPRQGYRLLSVPDAVTPREISPGLVTARFGRSLQYRESVGSTNDLAKEFARAGAPEGLLVIADEQTAGKGRLGRSWSTPKGTALAMSLVLRPSLPPYQAPRITLVAAVAVAEAVRDVTGLHVGIKWPNDLQIVGRKFCGILTEMEGEWERVAFVVCGMGLNVNLPVERIDPAYRERATSLMAVTGAHVGRALLVQAILARFEHAYDLLLSDRFEQVLGQWRTLSVTLGRSVRVLSSDGSPSLDGVAEEIDADGALLVRLPDGVLHRVLAGEVSIRPLEHSLTSEGGESDGA